MIIIPLRIGAAQTGEHFDIFGCFYPFGDDIDAERIPKTNQHCHDAARYFIAVGVSRKRAVNFERREGQGLEVGQVRIPRPEVID